MVEIDKKHSNRNRGQRRRRVRTLWRNSIFISGMLVLFCVGFSYAGWRVWHSDRVFETIKHAKNLLILSAADRGFVVRKILVEGRIETSPQDLLKALRLRNGSPILAFNTELARIRIEALPWIEDVVVKRQFPDLVHISLLERKPMALWQRNGAFSLIDTKGDLIQLKDVTTYSNLIRVVGDDAPANTAELFNILSVEPQLAVQIAAAVRVGGRRWNLHLKDQTEILLPEKRADAAWSHLARLYKDHGIFFDNLKSIDLRLTDRMVILQHNKNVSKETTTNLPMTQFKSRIKRQKKKNLRMNQKLGASPIVGNET